MSLRAALVALAFLAAALAPGARAHAAVAGIRNASTGDYMYVEEMPEAVRKIVPRAPDGSRGITGTVVVQALVGKDGLVKQTHVTNSVPGLDEAAVAAVRCWVFKPARIADRPAVVWVAVPVRFAWTAEGALIPPWPAPTVDESRAAFVQEVAALQAQGPRVPSVADTTLRRWIVQDALALEPRPLLTPEARARFERGRRARDRCACRESTLVAVAEFTAALHEAPWWGPAYGRLGDALLRLDRKSEAHACLELYLLAEPDAADRAKVEKRIAELRREDPAGPR